MTAMPAGIGRAGAFLAAALLAGPAARAEGLPDAEAKKREAVEILKGLQAGNPDAKKKIEESRKAIGLLEGAKKILDGLPAAKAGDVPGEVNALLFWARKMMPIASEPIVAKEPPPVVKEPPKGTDPKEPPPIAKEPPKQKEPPPVAKEPPPPNPEQRELEAGFALAAVDLYEERHPGDPFMLAVRFMEVAGRFQGTKASLEAQQKALEFQQRMMEEIQRAALAPPKPPGGGNGKQPPEPAGAVRTPGTAFDRIEGLACLYKQKNDRLNADVHYLWLQLRFFKGEEEARPVGIRLKAVHFMTAPDGAIPMGAKDGDVTKSCWENVEHDALWCGLSHQPVLDAPAFEKQGYPKKPIHASRDTLYFFMNYFPLVDPAGLKAWRVRVEAWDASRSRKLAEAAEMSVQATESAPVAGAEGAAEKEPDVEAAKKLFKLGEEMLASGKSQEAEEAFKRAQKIFEKADSPNSEAVANCLSRIGSTWGSRHQFGTAEPYIRKAMATASKVFGPDDPKMVPFYENYEALLNATGRREEARAVQERIVKIQIKGAEK